MYIYRVAQLFIVAFAAATLFLRTERHQNTLEDGRPYLGAILRQPFVASAHHALLPRPLLCHPIECSPVYTRV